MLAVARPAGRGILRRWLGRAALVGLFSVAGGLLALTLVVPRLVHGAALTVRSASMAPALDVGTLVIDRRVDPATLRVGDIATYQQASGRLITHRVVAIDTSGQEMTFTFRGDANRVPDPEPVAAGAIRGRVWFAVPYAGTVGARLAGARPLIVVAGVVALSGFAVAQFVAVARDRRRRS